MKLISLFLLSVSLALSAITGVNVRTTNTQATVNFTVAVAANVCSIEVSESPTYSPLVYDVDPAKFAGSNLDSRPGNIVNGNSRAFVVGKRTIEATTSNGLQSRALQTDTVHYFRITCPNGDVATGDFMTDSVAFGNSYLETATQDPVNPAIQAAPLYGFGRGEKFIDPLTGVQIQSVSTPHDRYDPTTEAFQGAIGSAWTTPSAALATTVSGSAGASITSSTAPLFIAADSETNGQRINYIFRQQYSSGNTSWNMHQATFNVVASGPNAGVDDQKFTVCATINGVNCAPTAKTYTFQATTTSTAFTVGTGNPGDTLQDVGQNPFSSLEVSARRGQATCNTGTPTVTWGYYDDFGPTWAAGTPIKLWSGTTWDQYFVSSVSLPTQSGQTLTLTTNCTTNYTTSVTTGGINFYAATYGLLIAKKTASSDTIKIQASTQSYENGNFAAASWPASGLFDICSPVPVNGANGHPGYNCALSDNGGIYWIDSITGDPHLFARYMGYGSGDSASADSLIFDVNDPDVWYNTIDGTGGRLFKHKYTGNHLEPAGNGFNENSPLPTCGTAPCVTVTDITKGIDFISLVADFEPAYQADRFKSGFRLAVIEDGKLIYRTWRSGNPYQQGWSIVFDPNLVSTANGCVGKTYAGSPGCVIAAEPSWSAPNQRWCNMKTNNETGMTGWFELGVYPAGYRDYNGAGSGPWQTDVTDGTSYTTTGTVACPTNSFGATGNNCINVTVSGEPYNARPCTASAAACGGVVESNTPGELQNIAPGDYVYVSTNTSGYITSGVVEFDMIVAKTDSTHLVLWRNIDGKGIGTSTANPKLIMACNANPDSTKTWNGAATYWDYVNDPHAKNLTGNTILRDNFSVNAHFYRQAGRSTYASAQGNHLCNNPGINCYGNRKLSTPPTYINTDATSILSSDPFFQGKSITIDPNAVQMHPWGAGTNTKGTSYESVFYDARPFNGGFYTGTVTSNGSNPGTNVGGYLWKYTAAQSLGLNRKFYYTYAYLGVHVLKDVSGPSSTLGQTSTDWFKYCVANAVNECVTGSAVGDVYVNGPRVTPYCYYAGQATSYPDINDTCIGDNSSVFNTIMQGETRLPVDNFATNSRALTHAFTTSRTVGVFFSGHTLPDGKSVLLFTPWIDNAASIVVSMKVPTAKHDSVNRLGFQDRTVQIAPPSGTDNVIIEFGYNEYGNVSGFPTCTTRAEICAVGNNTTGVQAVPFYFVNTESASLTGTPCATNCKITIPALPAHVLYWRAKYRALDGTVLSTGTTNVVAIP